MCRFLFAFAGMLVVSLFLFILLVCCFLCLSFVYLAGLLFPVSVFCLSCWFAVSCVCLLLFCFGGLLFPVFGCFCLALLVCFLSMLVC